MKLKNYSRLHTAFPAFILAGSIAALLASHSAGAATLYGDSNDATPGAGSAPAGTWGTSEFWSTEPGGTLATSAYTPASDVVFSTGADATGAFGVAITSAHQAASLTVEEGSPTFSGAGGEITLTGAGGKVVANAGNITIGNNTTTLIGGTMGLTKLGAGTQLTLSGSAVNTVTGGLTVTSGTLVGSFANLATPTDIFDASNVLTLNGGMLTLNAKTNVASSQTFASTTLGESTASRITLNPSGSGTMTAALGTITHEAGSLLQFPSVPDTTSRIATTNNANTHGILGPWAVRRPDRGQSPRYPLRHQRLHRSDRRHRCQ